VACKAAKRLSRSPKGVASPATQAKGGGVALYTIGVKSMQGPMPQGVRGGRLQEGVAKRTGGYLIKSNS